MGDILRNLALVAALLGMALPVAVCDSPAAAAGKKKQPPAQSQQAAPSDDDSGGDDKAKAAVLVQQIFEGGIKAYQVGKYEEALRAFEAAIRTGMPSQQMPRVLYYRGLTFRKLGKPGFAVSDLTSALWLKGGLSETERADAIKNRALAYNESGVSDVPPVPKSPYAEAPVLPGKEKPAARPPVAAGGSPAAPSSNTAVASSSSSSSGSGGIGGFFSNLFGGGSSSEQKSDEAPPSTASISESSSEGGGWAGSTEVVTQASPAPRGPDIGSPYMTQVAAVAPPGQPIESAPPTSGGIKLQVAAVRSRSEADSLAGLLVGRHAGELGGRKPEVDETVIGSMGTFYRVRVGPYASQQEPQQLCVALKADGFDCLIVSE